MKDQQCDEWWLEMWEMEIIWFYSMIDCEYAIQIIPLFVGLIISSPTNSSL